MSDLPDHAARGITMENCIEGNNIKECVFKFDKKIRNDGRAELSIQWLDCKRSVEILKDARKHNAPNTPKYILGYAVLKKTTLENI